MLDGILWHLIRTRVLGRDAAVQDIKRPAPLTDADLGPYARILARFGGRQPGEWVQCASASRFDPPDVPYGSLQYFKRFEADRFPARPAKVHMGSGHYRAWMLRTVYLPAETVTFYGCGKIDRVRDLLIDLTHLGNDSRVGWGEISEVTVSEIPEDRSVVWKGCAMRPIPVRMLRSWDDAAHVAWRTPYWSPDRMELCAPPGAEIELHDWMRAR